MKKQLFRWLFALAVLLPCLLISTRAANDTIIASGHYGVEEDNPILTWTLYGDGELIVAGNGAMEHQTAPWYSDRASISRVTLEPGVTSIGNRAFEDCQNLTSVTIPDSVTRIEYSAFSGCTRLTSVAVPASVVSLGENVFLNCKSLTSIAVDAGNAVYSSLDGVLFSKDQTRLLHYPGKSASVYTIPDSVTAIGDCAFYGAALTSVTIPDSVTDIGSCAFYCTDLTSVTIPDSVTTVGDYAFYCTDLTSVTMGGGVTTIGDHAFSFTGLTSVTIPDSVTDIGSCAFYCTDLTSVTIPRGVTAIGVGAFSNCADLTVITVDTDNPAYSSPDGVLFNKNQTQLLQYPNGLAGTYPIPEGVTDIGNNAFFSCTNLSSVLLPDSVTTIGDNAFYYCTGLTSIVIPDTVTAIGDNAFCQCANLTAVTMGSRVTTIGADAFYACDRLTELRLPSGLTAFGSRAFSSCGSLTSVTIPGSVAIPDSAFASCAGLTSVTIEEGVPAIGANAFRNCSSLTNVVIPDSVTSIGIGAFRGCAALTSVVIPDHVTRIEAHTFRDCTALTDAVIPDSVTSIGMYAFHRCASLPSVVIPDSVTDIGTRAFCGCSALTRVKFMGDAPNLGLLGFYDCSDDLTLYYYEDTAGWPSLELWHGIPLKMIRLSTVTITGADPSRGTVTVDKTSGRAGETVTVTATPNEGYYLKSIQVDGAAIDGNTFTLSGDHTVTASFAKIAVFYGVNIDLGSTLDMNFYFAKTNIIDPGSYARVVRTFADGQEDHVQTLYVSDWKKNGAYYQITYNGLAAKEMCDEISVTIYNSEGTAISETRTESMRSYVMRALSKSNAPALRTALVDMLNYGAAAQKNFRYNTGDPANSQMPEKLQSEATQSVSIENIQDSTGYLYGCNLDLESRILLNFYFADVTRDMYATVSYTSHSGEVKNYRAQSTDFFKNGAYYQLRINDLAVADGNTLVTCTVYKADGSVHAQVTDSMNSYISRALNTGERYQWMESIAKFSASAYNYLHETGEGEKLRKVTLDTGDIISVFSTFDADAGYVEATIVSSKTYVSDLGCMVRFDSASATTPGTYRVSHDNGSITLTLGAEQT